MSQLVVRGTPKQLISFDVYKLGVIAQYFRFQLNRHYSQESENKFREELKSLLKESDEVQSKIRFMNINVINLWGFIYKSSELS